MDLSAVAAIIATSCRCYKRKYAMSLNWWFAEKVPVKSQWLLVSGSSRNGAAPWGWQAVGSQWPQCRQCPHQPGHSPAVSELDGQRCGKITRSHQQPQARQGDKSSSSRIPVRSNRRDRRASRRDSEWTSISENRMGQGMPPAQLRQDLGVWIWIKMEPLDPGLEWALAVFFFFSVRAKREKGKLLVEDLYSEGATTTVHLVQLSNNKTQLEVERERSGVSF